MAMSWLTSTSSLPIVTLPAYSKASCSTTGVIIRQGPHQSVTQFGARLFEAAPGLVTWILILAPAWIPIIFQTPGALAVAGAVLVFDVYWFFRSLTVVTGVYSTLWRVRRDMARDWLAVCREDQKPGLTDPLQYYQLCVIPTYTEP